MQSHNIVNQPLQQMRRNFEDQLRTIVRAYHNGDLNPYCCNHSFIGYLLHHVLWMGHTELNSFDGHVTAFEIGTTEDIASTKEVIYRESQGLYELEDLLKMESKFLTVLNQHLDRSAPLEDAIYEALCATLQDLKAVHERAGETCYYEPVTKANFKMVRDEEGPGYTLQGGKFDEQSIGALLIAVFKGREENDGEKQRREMLRKQQRYN